MYYRYVKRRSTNYLNLDQIEQVAYYFVEDESGKAIRELAVYFISGRVYKERIKAEEIYKQLRRALESKLWTEQNQNLDSMCLTNHNNKKLPAIKNDSSKIPSTNSSIHSSLYEFKNDNNE